MLIAVILLSVLLAATTAYVVVLRVRATRRGKGEVARMEDRRSALVSIVSHQLRTPLSIIKGYLEALIAGDQGPLSDGQRDYLSDALTISKDGIRLVNDYLDAVRFDSTTVPVKPQAVDLAAVVQTTVRKLRLLATASNCQLTYQPPGVELPLVVADPIKVQQVVENIIANAIKYTAGKGSAMVTLQPKEAGVEFSCHDTGLGIPADQQDDVFTKFFRATNVLRKNATGSGLGLFFARMIIEALGGTIAASSTEGKGTTVTFWLPRYGAKPGINQNAKTSTAD
ncbi:MAG: HAMP domain-containing sensor histidine kinase [Patescibacteria group bacterium]